MLLQMLLQIYCLLAFGTRHLGTALHDPFKYIESGAKSQRSYSLAHSRRNEDTNTFNTYICSTSTSDTVEDTETGIDAGEVLPEEVNAQPVIPSAIKKFLLPLAMTLIKSKIKQYNDFKTSEETGVLFEDVVGCDEAKHELSDILQFIKNPEKFERLGAKLPKGVLLCGPPGTGKTLMAKAMAGEAGVPFISCAGSDFSSEYAGVGTATIKRLFAKARRFGRCIIFIDEIDTVGRKRSGSSSSVAMDGESTLNQLLVEMDGFDGQKQGKIGSRFFSGLLGAPKNSGGGSQILVLAGTNRLSMLDDALTRAGRFDRIVNVDPPDILGRRALFSMYMEALPLAVPQDLELELVATVNQTNATHEGAKDQSRQHLAMSLAAMTPGFTGAQIANTCNEAALRAATAGSDTVDMVHFSSALDRIQGGLERTRSGVPAHELKRTAVHEAGHAIMAWFQTHSAPPIKVSVVWRGETLGFMQHKVFERTGETAAMLEERMACLLGGRVAEELIYGDADTGASNDLQRVTDIAYYLVGHLGFSAKVGQLAPLSDRSSGERRELSEDTARLIDAEARRAVKAAYAKARSLLRSKLPKLKMMADALVSEEVLHEHRIHDLLGSRPRASLSAAAPYEEANLQTFATPPVCTAPPAVVCNEEVASNVEVASPREMEESLAVKNSNSKGLRRTVSWAFWLWVAKDVIAQLKPSV